MATDTSGAAHPLTALHPHLNRSQPQADLSVRRSASSVPAHTRSRREQVMAIATRHHAKLPPGGIPLPASAWKTVGGASIIHSAGSTFEVLYDPTYWGGLFTSAKVGCNYSFSGQARVISGSGYSFAVWASVDSDGTPHGESIQYDMDSGGYKDVALPDGSETGPLQDSTLDNNWHTITVRVSNGAYVSSIDGHPIFAGPMPDTCTQGLFIRLWRADIEFRGLSVTKI